MIYILNIRDYTFAFKLQSSIGKEQGRGAENNVVTTLTQDSGYAAYENQPPLFSAGETGQMWSAVKARVPVEHST
jgi:hypothetical protein